MSEVGQRSRKEAEIEAQSRGLVAIFPETNELQLDLDAGCKLNETALGNITTKGYAELDRLETTSKSGNQHLYILLEKGLSTTERIALQAAFGSDPVREVLSLLRVMEDCDGALVMFETPKEAKKVLAWRRQWQKALKPAKTKPYTEFDWGYDIPF